MPKVSVIVPNYNHALYLPQRIDSILHQTFQDFEILILDDCSIDNSKNIIALYVEKDARINYYFNSTNSGNTFKQWNKGIKLAKGEYIWFAESDDFAEKTFLEKTVNVLNQNEDVSLVYCDSVIVNSKNETIGLAKNRHNDKFKYKWEYDYINYGNSEFKNYLMHGNYIVNASGVLLRKNRLLEVGKANDNLKFAGDWLLYSLMIKDHSIAYISQPLNYYRKHGQSVTDSLNNIRGFYECYSIYNYLITHYKIPPADIPHYPGDNIVVNIWLSIITDFSKNISDKLTLIRYYHKVKSIAPDINRKLIHSVLLNIKIHLAEIRKTFFKAGFNLRKGIRNSEQKYV